MRWRGVVVGGGGERWWCEVVVRVGCDRRWQCELVTLRDGGRWW